MGTDAILGAVIGFVLGIIGNYVFEALGLKTRAAKGSKRRAQRRVLKLEQELKIVEGYHNDKSELNSLLLGRLILIQALWLGQSAVDYFFGLVNNGSYSASLFGLGGLRDVSEFTGVLSASASAVD